MDGGGKLTLIFPPAYTEIEACSTGFSRRHGSFEPALAARYALKK
jgi:hypothetical protein